MERPGCGEGGATKAYLKETLTIFGSHLKRYWLAAALVLIGVLTATGFSLYRPFQYKALFDGLASPTGSVGQLEGAVFTILYITIIEWFFWRIATFADAFLSSRVMSDLLNTCFKALHGHSYSFFTNDFVGSLVRKVTRFSKVYEIISDRIIWNLLPTFITIVTIITVLFYRHWLLGAIVSLWMIIYGLFVSIFIRYKLRYDLERAETDSQTSGLLADTITNNMNLKLFGGLKGETRSFFNLTEKLYRLRRFGWNLDSLSEGIQGAFMLLLEFIVLYAAIRFWRLGYLTIGDFALIQAYLLKVFHYFWDIGKYLRKVYESLAEAAEMTEILVKEQEIVDQPGAKKLVVHKGLIEFKDVQFTYHPEKNDLLTGNVSEDPAPKTKRQVFTDFNMAVQPGERVALVGPSGSGKSTIVKLLLRFYDIQGGEILIDGQNIAQVTQESLRNSMSLVPQEPILFHRSLMENIRYAKPGASDAEVIRAAKLAHCHEFISRLPEQYDSFVGERGVKLSGGERQRVAIARAILKDAPILVLDEATSSLDSESERYIQEALRDLMAHKTTIVIAHRLSTIMQMDRIIVIEKGKIIEEGKHKELLKVNQGVYQKLWDIQAGSFN